MRDEDNLWVQIESDPEDWISYLALADLYEEKGQNDEAEVLRWLAKNEKRPMRYSVLTKLCSWFSAEEQSEIVDRDEKQSDIMSDLPNSFICEMTNVLNIGLTMVDCRSTRDAFKKVLAAWLVRREREELKANDSQ